MQDRYNIEEAKEKKGVVIDWDSETVQPAIYQEPKIRCPIHQCNPTYHEMEIRIQSNVAIVYAPHAACIICVKANPIMHCNLSSEIYCKIVSKNNN